jgi:hypothetical protein
LDRATQSTSAGQQTWPQSGASLPEQGLLDLTLAVTPREGAAGEDGERGDEPVREEGRGGGSACCERCEQGVAAVLTELSTLNLYLSGEGLARVDAALRERAEEARAVVRLMEEVLDASVGVAEQTGGLPEAALAALDARLAELTETAARLKQDAVATLAGRAEEIGGLAERSVNTMAGRVEGEARRVAIACEDVLAEFRDARRVRRWAPWLLTGASAVMVVLALTLLRPGWTLSADQRRALRVGEAVVQSYSAASERERTEIRRVMGWRAPESGDSAASMPGRR